MTKYLLLISIVIFLFSCRKPVSEFNLKKYEYSQGEAIIYENLSKRDKNTKWELINDAGNIMQTFEGSNPNLVTGITYPDGVYTIKLTNYRREESNGTSIEKQFLLKSFKYLLEINEGNVNSNYKAKEYDVYVDNQFIGNPNELGQFSAMIPQGIRLIKLVSPSKTKEETFNFNMDVSIFFSK